MTEESRETSPLDPNQLSREELMIVKDIENRLAEEPEKSEFPYQGQLSYLQQAEIRHPRVMLLDGARGTGKTSLLLTLVKRWHYRLDNDKEEQKRVEQGWKAIEDSPSIPKNVRALPISDFDPLPPGMPLIASIVEAWRRLAIAYDKESSFPEDCDDQGSLMDRWHKLFQVAAAGWSLESRAPGLMDQVLDQQEKVRDWKLLDEQWRGFVEEVLKRGKCLKEPHRLPLDATFVLIIDDVDLQVARIRELLPAIRLLSRHHSVWFLVAGDSKHMLEMLRAYFLGQQLKLVGKGVSNPPYWMGKQAKWADTLARASFQKVFGLRNQFRVKPLSAKKFLQYPEHQSESMQNILNEWTTQSSNGEQSTVTKAAFGNLGDYLSTFLDDPEVLPEFMPYRLAHQIFEQAETITTEAKGLLKPYSR